MIQIDDNTPIGLLTIGQLKHFLSNSNSEQSKPQLEKQTEKYVYGVAGIARLFQCSMATATRIKSSGKIDAAIKQIGRKIIVDTDLALELVSKKKQGRYR